MDGLGMGSARPFGRAEIWWSWGESNPRPQAIVRQIYMLSWLIWF